MAPTFYTIGCEYPSGEQEYFGGIRRGQITTVDSPHDAYGFSNKAVAEWLALQLNYAVLSKPRNVPPAE